MTVGEKWNEWSLKVLEELTTLSNRQEQLSRELESIKRELTKSIEDKEASILDSLDAVGSLLNGNGSPEKGIIVRLDRIEQNEARRTWLLRTTIVASIGAILSTLATWFRSS